MDYFIYDLPQAIRKVFFSPWTCPPWVTFPIFLTFGWLVHVSPPRVTSPIRKMEVTLLTSPTWRRGRISATWRRRLWHCFYQLEGGALHCQYEGGGYGAIATNLKEKACVVVDANSKEEVDILNKEALALLHQVKVRDINHHYPQFEWVPRICDTFVRI